MARWYGDPVAVRETEDTAPERAGAPTMFLWRDRVYVVREVLGHWRERQAWWAGASEATGALAATGTDGPVAGRPTAGPGTVMEQEIWRLEAGAGGFGRGVFDLCRDLPSASSAGGWRLLRTLD